jgi:hypothetical protein
MSSWIQLTALTVGFLLMTQYGMFLTSLVVEPDAPLVFPAMKEVVEAGYRIRVFKSAFGTGVHVDVSDRR